METERLIRAKPEGKITGPLFPRIHIDDIKRIGPRAPPRNKMALYEQLSIPSQRFNNTPALTLPPPPVHSRMLTNMLSSQVGGKRELFFVGKKSHAPNHSNGKHNSRSYEEISGNRNGNPRKRSINEECQLLKVPISFIEPKNPLKSKYPYVHTVESDCRLPSIAHPRLSLNSNKNQSGSKGKYLVNSSCSLELQATSAKKVNMYSIEHNSKVVEERHKNNKTLLSFPQGNDEHDGKLGNQILQISDNTLTKISLTPLIKEEKNESSDHKSTSVLDQIEINGDRDNVGMISNEVDKVCMGVTIKEPRITIANNTSILRSESCNESHITDVHRQTLSVREGNQSEEKQNKNGMVDFERGDDSQTSVKECTSRGVISPDLVVQMIGQTHFWKARKEIIDQQRVFSEQLFELHRIVKVQKMLANCINLQKKEPLSLGNSLVEPTLKKLLPKSIQEAPSWHEKLRYEASKIKDVVDNAIGDLPLPPLSSDITSLATNFGKHANTNLSMWCLPPPGNQWLLPMISPSEGLAYKPYLNPPPPPGGFFPTLSSGFRPTNPTTTLGNEEFMNSQIGVHGVTPSPMDPSYFAPYGMSIISPFVSTPTFKQMSFYDVHSSTCTSNGTRNVGDTNENEKLENIEICPYKKIKTSNGALPLFPTTPSTVDIGQPIKNCINEHKTKVIKVIPRNNPKLASESVANIIKLIQEERKAMGSGSARLGLSVGILLYLLAAKPILAAEYKVGDAAGWTFNVQNWPNGKTFKENDLLS
ncbi:ELF3-like protein 2 [Chenopodium quinoa]|uniref:ELF3-like protein 2 n=1 Tax=Chenopodium quinoa TaxID=63459 RepID=UPI000B77E6F7|nr:ELF3-like protein 2 [Chenopodium quinoa]